MFRHSIVALITPMHANGELDLVALERLIEWHITSGTEAIVVIGSTGEAPAIDLAEREVIITCAVEKSATRVPILVGTGTSSTVRTIEYSQQAEALGADGCLVVTPYYNKPTQAGLIAHYQAIAESITLPIILYNVPSRTACDMLPETVAKLATVSNIVGIKEATGDLSRVSLLRKLCGEQFLLLSGDDESAMEFMLQGGDGVISVTANVVPQFMQEMCKAAVARNRPTVERLNQRLMPLHKNLFVETNPIPVKWATAQLQQIDTGIRLPLTWLTQPNQEIVRLAMQQAQIL